MNREQIGRLIEKAKALDVKISEKLLSLWQAGGMNGGQELYLVRQLESSIEQKQPKDGPHSAERALIERAKGLGVDTGPYSQLLEPGSVSSMIELRLKHDLMNAITEKEVRVND